MEIQCLSKVHQIYCPVIMLQINPGLVTHLCPPQKFCHSRISSYRVVVLYSMFASIVRISSPLFIFFIIIINFFFFLLCNVYIFFILYIFVYGKIMYWSASGCNICILTISLITLESLFCTIT